MATSVTVTLPEPFASIPKSDFLFGASPVHKLERITEALGGKVNIWAKREDCNSGIAYGGNKTRKLEYLIPEALEQGCDTLISIGGVQSNHTRQVAGVAAKIGLKAKLIQEAWVPTDNPSYSKVGNIQITRMMGGIPTLDPSEFGIGHKETLAKLTKDVIAEGGKPYYIPAGASDHPLGGLGFARWAFEVAAQEVALGTFFNTIVVCAVTGSTFAGMIAGFKLLEKLDKTGREKGRRVVGIDASATVEETREQALRIAKSTGEKIGLTGEWEVTIDDVILDERFHEGIYGVAGPETKKAMKFGAETEGFITDPVYEGKSLAGLMHMVRNNEIAEGSNVLYAHLGGQLALNAYPNLFDEE